MSTRAPLTITHDGAHWTGVFISTVKAISNQLLTDGPFDVSISILDSHVVHEGTLIDCVDGGLVFDSGEGFAISDIESFSLL